MAIDSEQFAEDCVRLGVSIGANPHYMLGVAELRSGIADGSAGVQVGPFRLTQAQWDDNRNDDDAGIHFTSAQITDSSRQCAVFAVMTRKAFNAFVTANNRNPSAKELYLQQWPSPPPSATFEQDFQKALDATAALVGPAADGAAGSGTASPAV